MTNSDKYFLERLFKVIIDNGYTINTEEKEGISDASEALREVNGFDQTYISIHNSTGCIGWFVMIFNNGFDMDECEGVIADYSYNEVVEKIMNEAIELTKK